MTDPAHLIASIRRGGGDVRLHRGHLQHRRVPAQLRPVLAEHAHEVVEYLQRRQSPTPAPARRDRPAPTSDPPSDPNARVTYHPGDGRSPARDWAADPRLRPTLDDDFRECMYCRGRVHRSTGGGHWCAAPANNEQGGTQA